MIHAQDGKWSIYREIETCIQLLPRNNKYGLTYFLNEDQCDVVMHTDIYHNCKS